MQKNWLTVLVCFLILLNTLPIYSENQWEKEIVYQIYPRSFYDSNGDGIGDLNGIREKIPYLKELGITTIWINPVFPSPFEHKYFADDFFQIDAEFGTIEDFRTLCSALHQNKMKILLDMETQYITDRHEIFQDAYQNPSSKYSDFIVWKKEKNTAPDGLYNITGPIPAMHGQKVQIASLNLANPKMLDYQKRIYQYWLDPNQDGNLEDGVDGFRMDHIMDDLDHKGLYTDLLTNFWHPIVKHARTIRENCFFLAEPADWGYGREIMDKTKMDAVFLLPLRSNLVQYEKLVLSKKKLESFLRIYPQQIKKGHYQFLLIENHDTSRFAQVAKNSSITRIGAVLNLVLKGVPAIYYGQELGMLGRKDIGERAFFPWGTTSEKEINSGSKTKSSSSPVSLSYETQKKQPDSIWNFYKKLITIRKTEPALETGEQFLVENNNANLLTFSRQNSKKEMILIAINLGNNKENALVDLTSSFSQINSSQQLPLKTFDLLQGEPGKNILNMKKYKLRFLPYEVKIVRIGTSK